MMTDDSMTDGVITTTRLQLVAATVEIVTAELQSRDAFAAAIGAWLPSSWPPALYDEKAAEYTLARLQESPEHSKWWMWYVLLPDAEQSMRTLIGTVGFKGPPNGDGVVEVGYGIAKQFQRQGYASEAVEGLVGFAFRQSNVKSIRAQTLPNLIASIGVMRRNGFEFLCHSTDEGLQTVVYELTKEAWLRRLS